MAVKNRGLPREVGEFFDQYEIEIIQRETASWYPDNPLFPAWVSALEVADTGEKSGLSQSMWGAASGDDATGDAVDQQSAPQHAIPMPKLTCSAKKYAEMMNIGMPCTPVHTLAERRKFKAEMSSQLYAPGDPKGRMQNYQSINFDRWAYEWNKYCAEIETGRVEWDAVYRKTSKQLESYHKNNFTERANSSRVTMMAVHSAHNRLRTSLQKGEEGSVFDRLVGVAAAPPVPRSRPSGGGAAGVEGVPEDVEMGGGGDDMGGGGDDFDGDEDGVGGGGEEGEAPPAKKAKGPKRGAQMCSTCGHRRQQGSYKSAHRNPRDKADRPSCNVPPEEYRPEKERDGKTRAGVKSWSQCNCLKCLAVG